MTAEEIRETLMRAKNFDKVKYVALRMRQAVSETRYQDSRHGSLAHSTPSLFQIDVKDNTFLYKKFPNTFKSRAAMNFLQTNGLARDDEEAIAICTTMLRYGMIANAKDGNLQQFVADTAKVWKFAAAGLII